MTAGPALVAAGPAIGVATVVAAVDRADVSPWLGLTLAGVAAVGLWWAGVGGGDVALAVGLAAVVGAALTTLPGSDPAPAVVLWAAGAVAAGEATGLARRRRSTAVPGPEAVTAELTWSAAVVAATLVGGAALLVLGRVPGPGGLAGEVVALAAVVGLGALAARTSRPAEKVTAPGVVGTVTGHEANPGAPVGPDPGAARLQRPVERRRRRRRR